ncbi:ABC transporter ATP-binding protein [Thalassomonas actiniarum]|uniref:ABC transporter ATP-binding protein n=1 Tax=Thalassomonas actiniarum TaxID=485447 RepID=A0AAF0C2G5_9GAMM|nr:ABC transporter ATP-binding protein [Thalassomonas actiniarum]WDD98467.1 ABC transporter ATP-binding protein [Thalassomonas actiniarum]
MSEILNLQQVAVNFDGKSILSDISLRLDRGEILGLLGPSGCGKTTLLNTLAGFVTMAGGEIRIDGNMQISPKHHIAPEHRHIGMIFQDYALFPHLTVAQNIAFGITKLSKSEQKQRISELLELLKLTEHGERYPHQLSGGQQQRVAIARALAPQPKLLLLDEPFSNIDARLRNELMLEIRLLLKKLQMTAIFVTHNKDEVFTFADKVAVMHEGKLLQLGKPAEVCQQPNCYQVADFLQLGSWIPYALSGNELTTAIGKLTDTSGAMANGENRLLLMKPQDVEICEGETEGHNVIVNHISVTEQGYHYHLASSKAPAQLAFDHLSLYSPRILALGQNLKVQIKPHELLVFTKDRH